MENSERDDKYNRRESKVPGKRDGRALQKDDAGAGKRAEIRTIHAVGISKGK